jgi:hypothetical protein
MREAPISCGFLASSPVCGKALALGKRLQYFASLINGSDTLAQIGCDKDATWGSLSTHCRALGWSKSRAIYELQNGLRYRTVPPGHVVDWHNHDIAHNLNVETGDLTLILGVFGGPGVGFDTLTVSIEVASPTDSSLPADAPKATAVSSSAQWAANTTRNLRTERKTEGIKTKAALARLLAAESEKAVKAGQIRRALRASYLEDQLAHWGIWPLSSFE